MLSAREVLESAVVLFVGSIVCRVISELELAWLYCSLTWGGSLEPDGMEFLKPNCSVLGSCRSCIRSFGKAWILGALARGTDGAGVIAEALAGLQGLQELTMNLWGNDIGPGAQWVPFGSLQRGVGERLPVVSKGELRKGSRWLRSASGDWRCPS